jgi:hypothetical protein
MAKLTVNETPTAQILAKAAAEATVTDATGRAISIRKPGFLAQFRIIETMGQSADIATYRDMVNPLIYICAIDGDPVTLPTNKLQLEALIQRIGDEGFKAVVEGIVKHFGQADADAEKAAVKK